VKVNKKINKGINKRVNEFRNLLSFNMIVVAFIGIFIILFPFNLVGLNPPYKKGQNKNPFIISMKQKLKPASFYLVQIDPKTNL